MHCHSLVNVQGWSVQCRVAVRPVRSGSSGSATGTPGYAQARVAVQVTLPSGVERTVAVRSGPSGSASGTLRVEWQCDRYARVRSGPSGSAGHTAKWRRAYRCGTLRVEWQCDRYARARVAVRITLPLAGERAGVERSGPSGSATGMLRGSLAAHAGACSRS